MNHRALRTSPTEAARIAAVAQPSACVAAVAPAMAYSVVSEASQVAAVKWIRGPCTPAAVSIQEYLGSNRSSAFLRGSRTRR